MFLVNQKSAVLSSKIAFAEKRLGTISFPDNTLEAYIKDLADWLNELKDNVRIAQNEFREFLERTNFSEDAYLQTEPQRRLLEDLLRTYEGIETSFYLGVDAFLPLIPVWINQRRDETTKREHKLLIDFIQELLQLLGIPREMMAIFGESHACLPLSWRNLMRYVVFATYSEIENLRRWVILTHEIGHIFYDLHSEEFKSSVIPQVMRKLVETKPPNIGQRELEDIIYIWTDKWIPELACDCFSVKTIGPPYAVQFMVMALNSKPDYPYESHPPMTLRVDFMMDILESLALPEFDVAFHRDVWNSYSRSVTQPSSRYILHEEVTKAALSGINEIVGAASVERGWNDVLATRQDLSNGKVPDKNLVSIVSAMALLEPTINLEQVYRFLLERHAPSSYAP